MTPGRLLPPFVLIALCFALTIACDDEVADPPVVDDPTDSHPPDPIDDLTLAYNPGEQNVIFSWTARRDDVAHDRPERYDIRYSQSFPFDWNQATRVPDPPSPLDPGASQEFVLSGARRGRELYASVRAIDAAGNESRAGSVAHVRVPGFSFEATCVDALLGAPVAGLDATVTASTVHNFTTGPDGRITLADLAGGTLGISLRRGSAPAPYHAFDDAITLNSDVTLSLTVIQFQQPDSPLYDSILALLIAAMISPGSEFIVKRWSAFPVPWYAANFVNVHGLDYRAIAGRAAERWNTRLGFQMFAPVAADPTQGVLVEFKPRSAMGILSGFTDYGNDTQGYPLHDRIWIVDDLADEPRLYAIMMHEFGHTIRLNHLPAGFIMYGGQPLPGDISDDEITMVQLLLALPNGTNLGKYDSDPPAP